MDILSKEKGKKAVLLGNEAIVRGALESGVQFVSTYPGTPASEVGNIFAKIAKSAKVYFEFSTNEKAALEAGIGASLAGLKTLTAMKHFGVNVCADSLMPFCYTGTNGPFLLFVADDPSCWSSGQSEQNSRGYSYLAHIPTLEPSEPQECLDFVKYGFELSEKFKIPVMLRGTTRVSHQSAQVRLSEIKKGQNRAFEINPQRFVTMPPGVLRMKKELFEKLAKIKKTAEKSPLNKVYNLKALKKEKIGIVASGVSFLYVMEALKDLGLSLPVLKLGFFYPLPEEKIKGFIKGLKKVLVVEELEPYLEKEIKILAKEANPRLEVLGKELLPEIGELKPETVILAIAKLAKKKTGFDFSAHLLKFNKVKFLKRLPQLCTAKIAPPGCPYWSVFSALKKAIHGKNVVIGGDIGCYMIGALPPHNLYNYMYCMGSSLGIAHGLKKAGKEKVIALIGDSTFFHAGIPALVNAVFNKSNPLIIIMNNEITAMTGHQPHPGMGRNGMGEGTAPVKIEEIVSACGVKNLKIIDPHRIKEMTQTIKEYLEKKEVSVIIARRMCALLANRLKKK